MTSKTKAFTRVNKPNVHGYDSRRSELSLQYSIEVQNNMEQVVAQWTEVKWLLVNSHCTKVEREEKHKVDTK